MATKESTSLMMERETTLISTSEGMARMLSMKVKGIVLYSFLSSIELKYLELQNEGHDLKIKINSSTDADDEEGAVTLADYFSSRANLNLMIRIKNIKYALSSTLDTLARSR